MQRDQALALVLEHVQSKNLIKHMLAAEAIMRRLALHFGAEQESWGLAGRLHDIDYDKTKDNPAEHALLGAKLLEEEEIEPEITQAVLAHAETGPRLSAMDKALHATDPLTGLLLAGSPNSPGKKTESHRCRLCAKSL